jgi:hypothetical protein
MTTKWAHGFYGIGKAKFDQLERDGLLVVFVKQRKLRLELHDALIQYLDKARAKMCCSRCGAVVKKKRLSRQNINLHHPDHEGHLGRVHALINNLATIKAIDEEIARCEPLCPSCHSRHHASAATR